MAFILMTVMMFGIVYYLRKRRTKCGIAPPCLQSDTVVVRANFIDEKGNNIIHNNIIFIRILWMTLDSTTMLSQQYR